MSATTPEQLDDEQRAQLLGFLREHPAGVLATVDGSGDPQASALYYGVAEDLSVSFTSKRDTQKSRDIASRPRVMLVVFDAASQTIAQIGGLAEEVTDAQQAADIYQSTLDGARRTGPDNVPPIAKLPAGQYVAYMVRPDIVTFNAYGWGDRFVQAMKQAGTPQAREDSTEDPA